MESAAKKLPLTQPSHMTSLPCGLGHLHEFETLTERIDPAEPGP